ncbi:FAST kinase domain-containing protein 5, mitochondrial [Acyrthosiphon pisum]|uniref:RAP domain-containing protein n=1 Tax=Acyrthosiphon pisum TaxID=7029 RepID=A0A8R2A618_ACYPI|nr:FAST kinase domain-containing protein 5, mitochondrial [Acyrthosiphon pisum]|eukprot:XP_001948198.2 PREDICTED: FAST kinase domain-containing protein 5 [Acyrthosiphon pisum]
MNRTLSRLAFVRRAFANNHGRQNAFAQVWPAFASSFSPELRTHMNVENHNAHNVMVNDPGYRATVVNPAARAVNWPTAITPQQFHALIGQDFSIRTADEVCNDFTAISSYAGGRDYRLADSVYDGLRDRLVAVLPQMTDEQLLSVLVLIPLWDTKDAKDPAYLRLWSEFDRQCIERHRRWTLNKLLLFMDHWYFMKLSRLSNFVWMGVRKLARKPSRLTPKQLVQMMFYANTSRKFLPTLPMYDIEQEICSYYNDFNIKELGIMSLGFFKTQTPIRNQELVKNLYNSVIKDIENINSIELAAFLKIFRYCSKHQHADYMYKLMDALKNKVDEVKLVCCVHMALLGTNLLIKHEDLLKKISQRIVGEISLARIKDLERITLALTMLNYNPQTTPCIFKMVVNELQSDTRNIEFEEHTRCYIYTLSYLAVNNIYPKDCISKALKIETLNKCFGKRLSRFNISRDIVSLNNSVLIECPDYSGSLLPDKLKESCNEHLAWHIPTSSTMAKLGTNDKNFIKLYMELLSLFKNESSYLHVCYPLPHHPKSDILFCIDTNGKPVAIPETMKNRTVFNDFQKPPELGKWFAVMALVRNSVLYYSNEYNGLTSCKIRQLKKLGYEPILFTVKELGTERDFKTLLSDKLKSHGITFN